MTRFLWISVLYMFFFTNEVNGQSGFFQQPTFSIGFFNHSIGIPFKDLNKLPLNIGMTLGVEFSYGNEPIAKHAQRVEVGFYQHKHLHSAVWLKSDYIRRFNHSSGFFGELRGGLGYMREFNVNQTFKLNSDGQYVPFKETGTSGLLMSVGVGTGYRFEVNEKYLIAPYVRYEGMIQTPYAEIVPFLPHSMIHVGSSFQLLN